MCRFVASILPALFLLSGAAAVAQQPFYPGAAPRVVEPEPLPPPGPASQPSGPAPPLSAPAAPPVISESARREFCGQPVSFQLADPATVAEPYRAFIGIWSDAAWTPSLCAALVVANVTPDGTATILYAFGPLSGRGTGGVLNGTGIIRDGELRFQNADGSQFAFHPIYADMSGRLTTPSGQTYATIFKKTL